MTAEAEPVRVHVEMGQPIGTLGRVVAIERDRIMIAPFDGGPCFRMTRSRVAYYLDEPYSTSTPTGKGWS